MLRRLPWKGVLEVRKVQREDIREEHGEAEVAALELVLGREEVETKLLLPIRGLPSRLRQGPLCDPGGHPVTPTLLHLLDGERSWAEAHPPAVVRE
eukprot:11178919-Lingulodinium_polyedra.AAC.1